MAHFFVRRDFDEVEVLVRFDSGDRDRSRS
jgi:hypothetical protein